jgi:hypothetical protein
MPKIKLLRNTVTEAGPGMAGDVVDASDKDARMLVSIGKAELLVEAKASAAAPSAEAPVAPKALSKMNRAELDAVVEEEGVDIGDATTNPKIAKKIADHRKAKASAAAQ